MRKQLEVEPYKRKILESGLSDLLCANCRLRLNIALYACAVRPDELVEFILMLRSATQRSKFNFSVVVLGPLTNRSKSEVVPRRQDEMQVKSML